MSGFTDGIENEYLKRIISKQNDVYFQFSLSVDGKIVLDYFDGLVHNLLGLSSSDIQKKPGVILDLVHPADFNRIKIAFFEKLFKEEMFWDEIRITVNEKIKWVKVTVYAEQAEDGYVFYGKCSDISKLKHQEEELKVSEARSQFANLASGIGVWDWNLVTNEVFYSAQSLKILEIENGDHDLISNPKKWDELVHPEDQEIYFGNIKEHFENRIPYYETYHRVLCNGKYKWILDRGKVIKRDNTGKPLRIIGTHTDVTAQKEEEEKIKETLVLVNNQKSKLLNFAHIVSHNLKNHAGNFTSLLDFYKTGMLESEEVFESLEAVSNELTSTLLNLVELVNIQQTVTTDTQDLQVTEFYEKVSLILHEMILRNNVVLINEIPSNFVIRFLPAYLESILMNLTTNAIKYSDPDKKAYIKFSVTENYKYSVLHVEDNGLGIDLELYKDSIFGLYKTFHRHEDSTGIGLYITKNQIEALGGKIEVQSEVGQKTIFSVYFKK